MFQTNLVLDVKQKALNKMLAEMNNSHTSTEDAIHNWLCDQKDDELFKGILKDGKTIAKAVTYCTAQAKKQQTGNVAMIDSETVFAWVRKYFISGKVKIEKVNARVEVSEKPKEEQVATTATEKRKVDPRDKKEKPADKELQLSLFDRL